MNSYVENTTFIRAPTVLHKAIVDESAATARHCCYSYRCQQWKRKVECFSKHIYSRMQNKWAPSMLQYSLKMDSSSVWFLAKPKTVCTEMEAILCECVQRFNEFFSYVYKSLLIHTPNSNPRELYSMPSQWMEDF